MLTADTIWVDSVAFSPDGRTVAIGPDGRAAQLVDVATLRTTTLAESERHLSSVALSPDGRYLATADVGTNLDPDDPANKDPARVRLWNLATGRVLTRVIDNCPAAVVTDGVVAFSRDGRILAASCDRIVKLWGVGG
jgi:WD40 repeat protein